MQINGRRMHLGDRYAPTGGTTRATAPLAPRASPEPELAVIWYPHRDAPSLLQPADTREDFSCARPRGAIVLVAVDRVSWFG